MVIETGLSISESILIYMLILKINFNQRLFISIINTTPVLAVS